MTQAQNSEARKAIDCLEDARVHLDNAMYHMGVIENGDGDYAKYRAFYDAICRALDLV